MEILGKLGIDIKLLIAQIINFGLLLWLLKKFLYAPIVRRIEKDERELNEAKTQKQKLEKEKEEFQKQKMNELKKAREKAEEIINEAASVAEKVKVAGKENAEKEVVRMLRQTRQNLQTLEPKMETEIKEKVSKKMKESLVAYFSDLPKDLKIELQDSFWRELMEQAKQLKFEEIRGGEIFDVLKELRRRRSLTKKGKELEDEVSKALSEKFGPNILESVEPPETNRLNELQDLISKKMKIPVKLEEKRNNELISGFRLEIAGIVIESNLLNKMKNEK